jgi:predicted transcriptional regulator
MKDDLISQFRALGDPTRYKLLQLINSGQNFCVSELASEVNVSTAGVSQQLKLLEQAGLIKPHRTGQKKCYQVNSTVDTKQLLQLIDQS